MKQKQIDTLNKIAVALEPIDPIVDKALEFAREKHKGQKYGNEPFIVHPLMTHEVIKIVAPFDYNLQAAALLHDTIEDCDVLYPDLVREFNQDVAMLVLEVTKEQPDPDRPATFPNLTTQRGIMLKLADRLSNVSNMQDWDGKKREWYLKKAKTFI